MEKVDFKSLKEGPLVECAGPYFKCEHHYLETTVPAALASFRILSLL